jgi:preprotein translocase subunit YajC
MLVSTAFAQEASAGAGAPDAMLQLLPIVLIFVVFYFLLIRPQQKKMKQHKEMLSAIRRGDRVVTGGGILGTVVKVVDDNELQVEIAEGVRVRAQRQLITAVVAKTEPSSDSKSSAKGGGGGGGSGGATDAAETSGVAAEETTSGPRPSRLGKILGGKRS